MVEKGAITLSPTFHLEILDPVFTTCPMVSCPTMKLYGCGWCPRYQWRSEPTVSYQVYGLWLTTQARHVNFDDDIRVLLDPRRRNDFDLDVVWLFEHNGLHRLGKCRHVAGLNLRWTRGGHEE